MGGGIEQVLGILLTLAAAAACATWVDHAWRCARSGPDASPAAAGGSVLIAGAVAAWAAIAAAGPVIALASPALAARLAWPLAVLTVVAVVLVIGPALASRWEAPLLATAVLGLGWGLLALVLPVDAAPVANTLRPLSTSLLAACVLALGALSTAQELLDGQGSSGLPAPRDPQAILAGVAAVAFTTAGLASLAEVTIRSAGGSAAVVATAATVVAYLALAAVPVLPGGLISRLASGMPPPRRTPASRAYLTLALAVSATALAVHLVRTLVTGRPGGVIAWLLTLVTALVLLAARWREAEGLAEVASELDQVRGRLEALSEDSTDVVLELDHRAMIVSASDGGRGLLQRPAHTVVGAELADLTPLADRPGLRDLVLTVTSGRRAGLRVEIPLAEPASGLALLRVRSVPGGAVATLSDVTETAHLRERIADLAEHDQVTGLANRGHLLGVVGRWLDAGEPVGVLHLDLDGFKAVNDRFGHDAGDQVLREVAQRLQNLVNADPEVRGTQEGHHPVLARLGGDEFVIALAGMPVQRAAHVAEDLLAVLETPFRIGDRAVRLGGGIGVAATRDDRGGALPGSPAPSGAWPSLPLGTAGAAELMHRADIATVAAKHAPARRVVVWDPPLEERARRKVDIAIELRRALDTGRLVLAYQPVVRLADGVIAAVEALVRVPTGEGSGLALAEVVSPAELVEVAEGTGEIDELGRWVLAEATHQAALWQRMGKDVRVAVNMSVRQLSDPSVVDAVRAALIAAHLPADRLIIEITEGQLLGEGDRADLTIRRLQADGVSLAIDDFGSGYSSLSYLRRMPVKTVKLDRTLLGGVGSDPKATTVVRAVIGAARGLGLQVVCEGLEDLATARLLRDLGAWAGQGFAFYRAMSSTELLDVLEADPVDLTGRPVVSPRVSHHETSVRPD